MARIVAGLAKPAHAVASWALRRITDPVIVSEAIGWGSLLALLAALLLLAGRAV